MSSDPLLPNSAARNRALLSAARSYRDALTPEAIAYLHGRGFDDSTIQRFGFGFVADPRPEHAPARGMLSIPYITPSNGIKAIRFRCIEDHVCKDIEHHGKYWGEAGARTGIFNTRDLVAPGDTLAVCEGELDAVTLSGAGILPAVAVPGANGWKPFYARMMAGFSKVVLIADGDDAGGKLASTFRKAVSGGVVIVCECKGARDVNEVYVRYGKAGLEELLRSGDESD